MAGVEPIQKAFELFTKPNPTHANQVIRLIYLGSMRSASAISFKDPTLPV
ncbi:hypothetical protein ACW73L_19380 [Methylolobus aquaticus]